MRGKLDQVVEQLVRHRIAAKPPHVAPPQHQIAERRAKGCIEWQMSRWRPLDPGHGDPAQRRWKKVPLTGPRRAPASATIAPLASQQSTRGSSPIETIEA